MGGRVLLVHGVLPAQDLLVPIPAHASAGSTVSPSGNHRAEEGASVAIWGIGMLGGCEELPFPRK